MSAPHRRSPMLAGPFDALRRIGVRTLDLLLPPRCLACGEDVDAQGTLCVDCWGRLTFLAPPQCARCGLPFEFAARDGDLCGACIRRPPPFDRARAVLAYDAGSRELVLPFKHADRLHAARPYGAWMTRAGAELLGDADLIVPVPLHRLRLFLRRYNQSALLALTVARLSGVPCLPDALRRVRRTPSQGGLNVRQRRLNVRGAFAVRAGALDRVRDARVILVDDVFTTGATVGACAMALRRAGAAGVDVLTLARVVRPL